jgi:hypothetical protein
MESGMLLTRKKKKEWIEREREGGGEIKVGYDFF